VFGLQTVFWNQDTADWSLGTGGTTPQAINASMTRWLNGPKQPGLMILEHELNDQTVQAFIDAYPLMVSTGWKLESAADIDGNSAYLNSKDDASPVERADGVVFDQPYNLPSGSSTSTSSTPSTPANPTSTPTGNNNTGSNTSQSGNSGSVQFSVSKLAGALGTIFLTAVFYAW
jgi:hypothetical protein